MPSEAFVARARELLEGAEVTLVEGCDDGGLKVHLHVAGEHRWVRVNAIRCEVPALGGSLSTTVPILALAWPVEREEWLGALIDSPREPG